jgi:hypothetical protein
MDDTRRALQAGDHIGAYRILGLLDSGGMGVVYRAEHEELSRAVAIKVLHPEGATDAARVERFRNEARAVAALRHPHIVQVYDFGVFDAPDGRQQFYLAMEYVAGSSLAARLHAQAGSGQALDLRETARVIEQIAAALDYAHGRGLVHRDVKPANILFTAEGDAVLGDFGLVASSLQHEITNTGQMLGTLAYMAPEQALDPRAATPASDVYALGVVAYEMLTGRVPFEEENPLSLALQHVSMEPTPPSVHRADLPPGVDAVILRALAKLPVERFASAGEFARALVAALPAPALPPPEVTQPLRPAAAGGGRGGVLRYLLPAGGIALIALVALLLAGPLRGWAALQLGPAASSATATSTQTPPATGAPATGAPYPGPGSATPALLPYPVASASVTSAPAVTEAPTQVPPSATAPPPTVPSSDSTPSPVAPSPAATATPDTYLIYAPLILHAAPPTPAPLPTPTSPPTTTPIPTPGAGASIYSMRYVSQELVRVEGDTFVSRVTFAVSTSRYTGLYGKLLGATYYPTACDATGCVFELSLPCSSYTRLTFWLYSGTSYWSWATFPVEKPAACP